MNAEDLIVMNTFEIRKVIENSSSADEEVKNKVMIYLEKEGVFSAELIGAIKFGMILGKMMQENKSSLDVILPVIDEIFDSND